MTTTNRRIRNRRIVRPAVISSPMPSSSFSTSFAVAVAPLLLAILLLLATSSPLDPGPAAAVIFFVDAIELATLGSSIVGGRRRRTGGDDGGGGGGGDDVRDRDLSSLACGGGVGALSSSSSFTSIATCPSSGSAGHYGVDRSFPIHHHRDDGVADFYVEFMDGCRRRYDSAGHRLCDASEEERMGMNLRQPASVKNYTTLGFHKVRAPPEMMTHLARFWNGRDAGAIGRIPDEVWPPGNTYTNHWSSPTKMLQLRSGTPLRRMVWDASRDVLERWTSTELVPSSLYGVRVYGEGSVLAPHVDRMPLVISAVVNVAQDVDEPWPLEVYGHDGRAYNITMEVGDMILYEGHSVVHGRPFPLKGRYYANVFVHFEPLGHTLLHHEERGDDARDEDEESLERLYQRAWKKLKSKCVDDDECRARVDLNVVANTRVPPYILPGSEEERRWLQTHPKARLVIAGEKTFGEKSAGEKAAEAKVTMAHTAASSGDLKILMALAARDPELVKAKDHNGWTPLHEAARGGHLECVKFLIRSGLDKDERTHWGDGGSPLWWARKIHGHKHSVSIYLESIGAVDIPPNHEKK